MRGFRCLRSRPAPLGLILASSSLVVGTSGCGGPPDLVVRPERPANPVTFTLQGQFDILAGGRFPALTGLPFGGISGLAAIAGGAELYGISDDHVGNRVYRFGIAGSGPTLRVETLELISLQSVPASLREIDAEGIAVLPNGHLLVSSEGIGTANPRIPPALVEFTAYGEFVREWPVPERFAPDPTGDLTRGVRANLGFESLTISPDGARIFTASEAALVQDGDLTSFDTGSSARIIEYRREGPGYVPGRELVYRVEPTFRPPFEPALAVNGLVELLALPGGDLLALERCFVREKATPARDVNRIRLFRISLAGATDVSGVESLKGAQDITPVTKTLLLDLSDVPGLSPQLAPSLDNFEGMAFGAPLPDGRLSFLLVSDDNFNPLQRTWFLQFAVETAGPARR